jgi:quinol monooxygenase YgiN
LLGELAFSWGSALLFVKLGLADLLPIMVTLVRTAVTNLFHEEVRWNIASHIRTDVELSIKEGKLDDFKALVNTKIKMTDANEPNALVYEWHISEDGSECHLLEIFKDSNAFMVHLGNASDMFGILWELAPLTGFKIYGSPSAELKQALDPVGIQYFAHFMESLANWICRHNSGQTTHSKGKIGVDAIPLYIKDEWEG